MECVVKGVREEDEGQPITVHHYLKPQTKELTLSRYYDQEQHIVLKASETFKYVGLAFQYLLAFNNESIEPKTDLSELL